MTGLPWTAGSELFWLTFPNTLFPMTPGFEGPIPLPKTLFATLGSTLYVPILFSFVGNPVVPVFSTDPLDKDFVASTNFVSGCLPFTNEDVAVEGPGVGVTGPVFFKALPIPVRPTVLGVIFAFPLPLTLPSLLALLITTVVEPEVEVALKPILVFGLDGMGAFSRSRAFDKLIRLAGL